MGNITDIPPELLKSGSEDKFYHFLVTIPLIPRRKLELYFEWKKETHLTLPRKQLEDLGIWDVLVET